MLNRLKIPIRMFFSKNTKIISYQSRKNNSNKIFTISPIVGSRIYKNLYKTFVSSFKNSSGTAGDPYPDAKSDFYDENDLIINIGEKEKFKGQLVICPTPIGNLNDISIRQYEALKNGDLIACEDTRKTGKMLELIQQKKMKEKFYSEFGISFEEFVNRGGLDMTDEQIQKEFFSNRDNDKDNVNNKDQAKNTSENYNDFYQTKEDMDKYQEFVGRQNSSSDKNNKSKEDNTNTHKTNDPSNLKSNDVNKYDLFSDNLYEKVVDRVRDNRRKKSIYGLEKVVKEVDLNYSEADQKKFINDMVKNTDDPVTSEYYSQVQDSEDFMRRKTIIENSEEKLKEFINPLAEGYDDKMNLSYKMRNKAKFIMGLSKIYSKEKKEQEEKTKEEELEEEINLHSGLDENYFNLFKKRIKEEKEKKGRGLLVSFNQENEENKIPKLIRAMKMGLRVVMVSDAGTPTISDPGYRLVKETSKNGIIIEPLPGPSAVLTALSASALPTDKFLFVGYLPKNPADKKEKLEEIKKIGVTTILFESPVRLKRTLETIGDIFGKKHEVYIGQELTKKFETHLHGKLENVLQSIEKEEEVKGEITLILSPIIKTKEEIADEKMMNEEFKIDVYEFSQKLNSILKLSDKDFRNVLTDICNLSSFKANKIISSVKNRDSQTKKFYDSTKIKENLKIKPLESFLVEENENEGKTSKFINVLTKNRKKNSTVEGNSNK